MDSIFFRVTLALLLIGFVVHRGFYTRKIQHRAESILKQPKPGRTTQIANLLTLLALFSTIIYIVVPNWMSWSALPIPTWLRWLGIGIALGGFALLQWAQHALGKNWSDDPKLIKGQELVSSGPYHWIRHPIYSAFLLILGAFLPISANWFAGGLWISAIGLAIAARIDVEEKMMLAQFGEEYRAYMQKTGRLWPRMLKGRPDAI